MSTKVLFIVPYPKNEAPSQRFRVELYERILKENDIEYEIASFLDKQTWDILFRKGNLIKKSVGIAKGYLRRIGHLFKAIRYDSVFIHREAAPLGPPVFEWLLAKLLRKRIIYDFDDAIWIPNVSNSNKLAGIFKSHWKVKYICKWAKVVTAGNQYLHNYASRYCSKTILLPTCVDTENIHNKKKTHHGGKPVVGWTGSHSTLFYLNSIVPLVMELQQDHDFTFLVIADKKPELALTDWKYLKWNEKSEAEDLLNMDIGIMPLKEDAWSEGKCGFKLIQYLSCGIPALADPVGVNRKIVQDGVNGFICKDEESWREKLTILIKNSELRADLGSRGRQCIIDNYSIQSQKHQFLELFTLAPTTL
jgi:glycosyltransferase involved in cell wall biosynthesis